jgi:primosomal protein N'
MRCRCTGVLVNIATGEVSVFRCTTCFATDIRCVKCCEPVGGTKDSEWLELKCRHCGHETNIRKLASPSQLTLFPEVSIAK